MSGKRVKRYRERYEAADFERMSCFLKQLREDEFKDLSDSEANARTICLFEQVLEGQFKESSDRRAYEKIICFFEQGLKNRVGRQRELVNAEACDNLDRFIEHLRECARSLKRADDEFQDVELLARILKPVIEAIEGYETLAKPKFPDPCALNELANALQVAFFLGGTIHPMTKDRARMARIREKRSSKSQARDEDIAKYAKPLRVQHPNWSNRRLALELSKATGLCHNTVEKKLSKLKEILTTE